MQIQIHIGNDRKEIKKHGDYGFPVNVSPESITQYEGGVFLWHWHPEIELTWIIRGKIRYLVNDIEYILKEGQGLFCNSNAAHSGYRTDGQECDYLSITFHPRLLYGYENSVFQTKYMDFILSNADWGSLALSPETDWQRDILEQIQYVYRLSRETPLAADYELRVRMSLEKIWQRLFCHYAAQPDKSPHAASSVERLKSILSFIHEHYAQPLTLEDIAASANICRSECCRFFKKHMKMTLFEYLMFYRVQQSLPLLKSGESVTHAAGLTGFSDACYYGKIFKRYMGCTPSQYRKKEEFADDFAEM